MEEALIQYKNVEIHQQELCVLSDVNLELHKGEFVYLIGKVGSGKTSLLKTLYGELDVNDGEAEEMGYNMRSFRIFSCSQTVLYTIIWNLYFVPQAGKTNRKSKIVLKKCFSWWECPTKVISSRTSFPVASNSAL